jgi:hypothetical protein
MESLQPAIQKSPSFGASSKSGAQVFESTKSRSVAIIMRKTSFDTRKADGSSYTIADVLTITSSIQKRGGNLFAFLPRAYRDLGIGIIPQFEPVNP